MKKIWKKSISLMLAVCMMAALLTACGNGGGNKGGSAGNSGGDGTVDESGLDTSKKVDLVFYLMGDEPDDMAKVSEKINEILLEKINATITFNFTTWTDWQTKYNMVLSSGEACDLIFVANWVDYATLAKRNAFLAIDDLLEVYAPDIKATIDESRIAQMAIDGKIFGIPNNDYEYTNTGFIYREDLRKKYDLPVPDSLENIEAYLMGVKENEPTQGVLTPSVNSASYDYSFSASLIVQSKYSWVSQGSPYGLAAEYENPSVLFDYWRSDEFREDMKMMQRWADAGLWSKSVLSDSNVADSFENGQSVASIEGVNPAKYISSKEKIGEKHDDWEVGYVPYAKMNGVAYAGHATGNGTAVTTNSKNPERALMALNLLMTDKELNHLLMYGIEGEHYNIDENGYYVEADNNESYRHESANAWGVRNEEIRLNKETDEALYVIFEELAEIAAKTAYPDVDISNGFIEDPDGYSTERAALSTVMVQYLAPIQAGLVSDVDAAIDEFLEKADQAGLAKIQEAYKAQWEAYCEEYGYK